MIYRLLSIAAMLAFSIAAWTDDTVGSRALWTFDNYTLQTDAVFGYDGIYLHGGDVFTTDDTHMASTSGTFTGSSETWTASKVLVASQGTDLSALGNISASIAEGPAGSLAFNHSISGMLYVVYGAASTSDGSFRVSQKRSGELAYTTLIEEEMQGIAYTGPLSAPSRAYSPYKYGQQQLKVALEGAGTVYFGGSQAYCIYAVLFVPVAAKSEPSVWDFVGMLTKGDALQFDSEQPLTINLRESSTTDDVTTWSEKKRSDFEGIANFDGKLAVRKGASGVTERTYNNITTYRFTQPFVIRHVGQGDEIVIRYIGGGSLLNVTPSESVSGALFAVDGMEVPTDGGLIEAGKIMKVTQAVAPDNYLVLRPTGEVDITGIFINHAEVDIVSAPVITDKGKNLIEVTAGNSLMGRRVITCYTTDGTDPTMTNGTSGPYDSFEVEVQDHNGIFEVRAVSYTDDGVLSPQNNLVIYVSGIPSLTDDEQPDDDVPEIDYQQPEPAMTSETVKYYISPSGNDNHDGLSEQTPLATLGAAQAKVKAGDVVYVLPGTYQVTAKEISREEKSGPYKIVFDLSKSGEPGKPISYVGVPDADGNRPVFDLSRVNPAGYRVTGFLVSGSYLLLKNFEVVGIRVNIATHTQSENIRVSDGQYNTFENIACHDGMGIGFYLHRNAAYNLIVNCDGYNNYDYLSEDGAGDQNDGFGCHVKSDCPNNIFIGCRAWNNADDGFDLISCASPVTFCYSVAYRNGYDADGVARHDGNGFKAGGYGMSSAVTEVSEGNVPMHEVYHNLAVSNRSNGIYSNHHLGGIHVYNNSSYKNSRFNYSFVNRKGFSAEADEMVDVDGYGHVIENNLSMTENGKNNHVTALNGGDGENTLTNNSFEWTETGKWVNPNFGTSLYVSTKNDNLTASRDTNGMLSKNTRSFLHHRHWMGYGCSFEGYCDAIYAARAISGHECVGRRGSSTAIREVKTDDNTDALYVNLQGVETKNPGEGLYIYRGRKIVIR